MNLLLDTCSFLWLVGEPGRLSADATAALNNESNDLFLSDVTLWEIVLKHGAGKLPLPASPRKWIPEQIAFFNLQRLSIQPDAVFQSGELPAVHRDPFDRLLAAQAIVGAFQFVTSDKAFDALGVNRVW